MKALITGGAGFIGSHLVKRMLRDGHKVVVLDNLSAGKNIWGEFLPGESALFIKADINDHDRLEQAVKGVDVIFHLAAKVSIPDSIDDPVSSHLSGGHATLKVLDSARRSGVKKVILASSAAVYGNNPSLPKRESMIPQALSPYAAEKLAGEYCAAAFSNCYGLKTTILRYFNVFGPRQVGGVVALFCSAFASGKEMAVYGGDQTRDFVFVEDVVEANVLAMSSPHDGVFNVGTGRETSVNDVRKIFEKVLGRTIPFKYLPSRGGDIRRSVSDIGKIRAAMGYSPKTSLADDILKTYQYQERIK